jgi:curli biogenesis system outer membrane secretion channel CsgG
MTPKDDSSYEDLAARYISAGERGERPDDPYEVCLGHHYDKQYDDYIKRTGRKPVGGDHANMIGYALKSCEKFRKGDRDRMEKWDLEQKLKAIINKKTQAAQKPKPKKKWWI